jgi:hypothetical protein
MNLNHTIKNGHFILLATVPSLQLQNPSFLYYYYFFLDGEHHGTISHVTLDCTHRHHHHNCTETTPISTACLSATVHCQQHWIKAILPERGSICGLHGFGLIGVTSLRLAARTYSSACSKNGIGGGWSVAAMPRLMTWMPGRTDVRGIDQVTLSD